MTNREYIDRMGDILSEAPKERISQIFVDFVASFLASTDDFERNWRELRRAMERHLEQIH
jgi:hypothetical protein